MAVALFNTQKQINANADNVTKQLGAQLNQALRTQRRETLIKAAEVVHRLMIQCSVRYSMYQSDRPGLDPSTRIITWTDEQRVAVIQDVDSIGTEMAIVAVTLEIEGLGDLTVALFDFHQLTRDYVRGQLDEAAIDKIHEERTVLIDKFADALRADVETNSAAR
ncbi:hypothetical protein PP613_03840 [Mycobacteroides abscessus]|nr:hypothetical protein [Mycobacteroides abscessus]MDM2408481.1 hypothetical protein [Mycobacteroides abscessus]